MKQRFIQSLLVGSLILITPGCGQTRKIDPATLQEGPLVGTWQYAGDDLVDANAGIVRNFVIGDGTWYIPDTLTFRPDGTSKNVGYHDCHYWILGDGKIKLSVGNGNRIHEFKIDRDTLSLKLFGPFDGTSQKLIFTRAKKKLND